MTAEDQSQPVMEGQVGLQLREAREKLGLSLSDIANQQHLRPSVIQSIEEGDYSKVDTELFLKGYVRTYARQVDLDPDALIAALDSELEPLRQQREREQLANPLVDIERKKRRKRQIARLVMVILFLSIAGYLAYNFVLEPKLGGQSVGADTIDDPQARPPEDAVEPMVEEPVDSAQPITEGVGQEVVAAPEATVEEPQPEVFEEVTPSVVDSAVIDAAADEQIDGAPDPVETEPTVSQEPSVQDLTLQSSGEPTPVGVVRLEMSFSDDCWVQITDGEGNRLVSALRSEGDALDVSGQPPLKVVVGAMSALESLQFQGEPMDLDQFRVVNNRSEFTLEP